MQPCCYCLLQPCAEPAYRCCLHPKDRTDWSVVPNLHLPEAPLPRHGLEEGVPAVGIAEQVFQGKTS